MRVGDGARIAFRRRKKQALHPVRVERLLIFSALSGRDFHVA